MNRIDLYDLIRNGENSKVEFKRDDVRPERLAVEMAALLSLEGGHILLGVDDDGRVSGLTRHEKAAEEWVMNIAQNNLQPPAIPVWQTVRMEDSEKVVGVIRLPADAPDKPYKARRGTAWVTFVRIGSTSHDATREQEMRLYQSSKMLQFDLKPIMNSGLDDLSLNLLQNYLSIIQHDDIPPVDEPDAWRNLLLNLDILAESEALPVATVAGLLLFGGAPRRKLPQSGITATAYPGIEKDYNTVDEEEIHGPLVSRKSESGDFLDKGVIDRGVDFVERNMGGSAQLKGGIRERKPALPMDAVRESIVNAVAHRDYAIFSADIEISLYQDRLEVISPGRLPNGATVSKMKEGFRATRNPLLKDILRDYDYIEHRGMGVRRKIIDSMRKHNRKAPDLAEDDDRFIVRLWK